VDCHGRLTAPPRPVAAGWPASAGRYWSRHNGPEPDPERDPADTPASVAHAVGDSLATVQVLPDATLRTALAVGDSLATALAAVQVLPDATLRTALAAVARSSFVSGFQAVSILSAVLLAGTAVLILVGLRHLPAIGRSG